MIELQIIILGMIQGITEFLPISSSAHLILVPQIFNWPDQKIHHDIAVHVGTLGAVIFYLRNDIVDLMKDIAFSLSQQKSRQEFLYMKIIISTMPAIVVGFLVYNYLIDYFRNMQLIAYSCIIFGLVLFIADKYSQSKKIWSNITFKDAIVIGIFQCFAFIPGASRAGVTITGSRLLGFSRESAAIYSMLLSIPIIFASLVLVLPDFFAESKNNFNLIEILVSSLISFITAFLSIKFMIALVKRSTFSLFVIYRVILGIVILIWVYI